MSAVLTCGPGAVLSYGSAAALWGVLKGQSGGIEISVPSRRRCRRKGIRVHRPARLLRRDTTLRGRIPVTTPVRTLIDLAARLEREPLEEAINEAVRQGLTSPKQLLAALPAHAGQPGIEALTRLLEGFNLTDSRLERLFLPIAKKAGLPKPLTQQRVNGFRVDFFWPDLGLVVETDGGAFHRTSSQQTDDRRRDQTHYAAGLTPLRFTHHQVVHDAEDVQSALEHARRRLA